MKMNVTYTKVEKITAVKSVKTFEVGLTSTSAKFDDGFELENLQADNGTVKFDFLQNGQLIINVALTEMDAQTLHLKFYDFDVYVDFEIDK